MYLGSISTRLVCHRPLPLATSYLCVHDLLYANDFTEIEKTGKTIAQYLLKVVYEIANLNILQIVNGNAYNCKVGPCEIEK